MPSVKPILRTDKLKSNGEAPLYVRVISNRKPKYKSLGLSIFPHLWDEKKEKVKPSHPNSTRFNHLLFQKLNQVNEAVIESEFNGSLSSPLEILSQQSTGLLEYSSFFISRRAKINKFGMIRRMKSILAKISCYLDSKDVSLSTIDVMWLNSYEQYLLNELNNSTNTVASNMSGLRTIMNEAEREGLLKNNRNPFDTYRIRKKATDIEFLTDLELDSISNLVLKPGTKLERHRDLYVFACYTAGIRISDLLTLKWKNFDGERLRFTTRKTGQQMNIKLGDTALKLISKLENSDDQEAFIFNLIPHVTNLNDEAVVLAATSSANAYANKNLGVLAQKAGIEKHIHFHTSRHTWATRMLRRGMRIEHVSKLLGHKSIRTTQIYAKIVSADLDQAINQYND